MKPDKETGRYFPLGPIDNFVFSNRDVRFVFVVYWLGVPGESFSQSFTMMDAAGNILNEVPETEYQRCPFSDQVSPDGALLHQYQAKWDFHCNSPRECERVIANKRSIESPRFSVFPIVRAVAFLSL
jgi:hypothetical protein